MTQGPWGAPPQTTAGVPGFPSTYPQPQPQQSGDPFIPAPDAGGFKPSEYIGSIAAFRVHEFIANAQTPNGVKDACLVDFACLQHATRPEMTGTGYYQVRIYNPGVVDRVRASVGQTVLGRIVSVPSTRSGGNPAVIFEAPHPEDIEFARQVWRQGDPFLGLKAPAANPQSNGSQQQQQQQQPAQGGYAPQSGLPPVPPSWAPQAPPPGPPPPSWPQQGQQNEQPPF